MSASESQEGVRGDHLYDGGRCVAWAQTDVEYLGEGSCWVWLVGIISG